MEELRNLLSIDIKSLLNTGALIFTLASLITVYISAILWTSCFPARRGGSIPRISWLQLFDIKAFCLFPLEDIIKSVTSKSEKEGYQVAEHPYDQSFFVWDVEFVQHVIKNPSLFPPYILPDIPKWQSVLSSNFFVGDLKRWRAARQVVSPLLRLDWNPLVFLSATKRLLRRLEATEGKSVDALHILDRTISEVLYEVVFGIESENDFFEDGREGGAFLDDVKILIDLSGDADIWLTHRIFDSDFLEKKSRLKGAQKRLEDFIRKKEQALVESIPSYTDLGNEKEMFPRLLNACESGSLPHSSIFKDAISIFVAGQTSTANLVNITLYQLARNQQLQEAVRKEIDQNITKEMPESKTDFQDLKLCKAALDETLRMAPPLVFTLGHEAMETCTIGTGGIIPEGSILNFFIAGIHRDPKYFDDPKKYDPYRWLTEDEEKLAKMKKAFMPFGFGGPICPGRTLAKIESITMLVAVLKTFNVKMSSNTQFEAGKEPFNKVCKIITDVPGLYLHFEKR